jgi:hypothetical protein
MDCWGSDLGSGKNYLTLVESRDLSLVFSGCGEGLWIQDLNLRPTENEAGVLLTWPRPAIIGVLKPAMILCVYMQTFQEEDIYNSSCSWSCCVELGETPIGDTLAIRAGLWFGHDVLWRDSGCSCILGGLGGDAPWTEVLL